jgi:hypothetical protein
MKHITTCAIRMRAALHYPRPQNHPKNSPSRTGPPLEKPFYHREERTDGAVDGTLGAVGAAIGSRFPGKVWKA